MSKAAFLASLSAKIGSPASTGGYEAMRAKAAATSKPMEHIEKPASIRKKKPSHRKKVSSFSSKGMDGREFKAPALKGPSVSASSSSAGGNLFSAMTKAQLAAVCKSEELQPWFLANARKMVAYHQGELAYWKSMLTECDTPLADDDSDEWDDAPRISHRAPLPKRTLLPTVKEPAQVPSSSTSITPPASSSSPALTATAVSAPAVPSESKSIKITRRKSSLPTSVPDLEPVDLKAPQPTIAAVPVTPALVEKKEKEEAKEKEEEEATPALAAAPAPTAAVKRAPPGPSISSAAKPRLPPGPSISSSAKRAPPGPSISSSAKRAPPGPSISSSAKRAPPGPSITTATKPTPPGPSISATKPRPPPGPSISAAKPTPEPSITIKRKLSVAKAPEKVTPAPTEEAEPAPPQPKVREEETKNPAVARFGGRGGAASTKDKIKPLSKPAEAAAKACGECGCETFKKHPFKKSATCQDCFHDH
jgi:hypothetical protein